MRLARHNKWHLPQCHTIAAEVVWFCFYEQLRIIMALSIFFERVTSFKKNAYKCTLHYLFEANESNCWKKYDI